MLGQIFTRAQNKIQDPAKLYRLIDMVDGTEWVTMGADIKGDIYEELLEKNAEDNKSGAGQYFTPRALIHAVVECVRPEPGKLIADPACGTGGFFLAAYDFIAEEDKFKLDKPQKEFLKHEAFHGNEEREQEKDDLTYNRQDFRASTSNKPLNFVQHIRTMLKTTGHAAVVVPDNVLFEGGAGETIRRKLLANTDLHTILRLPTGVLYAQGVKANVIFYDNREASPDPWTKEAWYYDYRTNIHHTLKKKSMRYEHVSEFIECYTPRNRQRRKATWDEQQAPDGRWRSYGYEELTARDKTGLDVFSLKV